MTGEWTPAGVISITTDFGTADGYVGAMHGVIATVSPVLRVIDLTHAVAPQCLREAAFHLAGAWRFFPVGTVHLVVVDPGVGTQRGSLVAEAGGHVFVAPDNGVLPLALESLPGLASEPVGVSWRLLDTERFLRPNASRTFHGRDLYAPVVAALASGHLTPETAGEASGDPVRVPLEPPRVEDDGPRRRLRGEVLHVDRFGNVLTNLHARHAGLAGQDLGRAGMQLAGREVPFVSTYGDASPGQLVALVDSFDLIEVARVDGSAAAALGVAVGDPVTLIL